MGVLVSPAARSAVPKMMPAVRGSSGRYKIRKYLEAVGRIWGSTCIQTGIAPLRAVVRMVQAVPITSTERTACAAVLRAVQISCAPQALEIIARKPTLKAVIEENISHPTVVVAPTAAVAWVPSVPTMAVSIYWTADCIVSSSIVGQASAKITRTIARDSLRCLLKIISNCPLTLLSSPEPLQLKDRKLVYPRLAVHIAEIPAKK